MSGGFDSYFGDSFSGGPPVPPAGVPALVAGRYEMGDRLGRGSFGVVHRAADRITGAAVAVKLLDPGTGAERVRREVVALRGLRLPGVVRLLDEGVAAGRPFLVMELVEGNNFPGVSLPAPWATIEDAAASLLEVLGRVHAAGALHLDIKPANVRVTPAGTVVLLDLGLAHGPALGGAAGRLGGTEHYVAPELVRDGTPDARSDLYSVGVMLWDALTSFQPLPASGAAHAHGRRGHAPDQVWRVIDALLAREPARRPASAWAALDRLLAVQGPRPGRWTPPLPPGEDALDQAALQACFHGPERLLHLPSDAAARLHRRTGGARERVAAELDRWIRLGLVVPEGERLRVQRVAIDQLDAMAESERLARPAATAPRLPGDEDAELAAREVALARLVHAGRSDEAARAALDVARMRLVQGRFDRMRLALEQALLLIRRQETSAAAGAALEPALLALWALMALEQRRPAELEVALYEVERAVHRTAGIDAMAALLRAALYEARGSDLDRAREQLEGLARLDDPLIDLWRHTVRLRLAAREGVEREAEMLAGIEEELAWGRDMEAVQARVLSWRGRLCFQRREFEEAAALQERAARFAQVLTSRLGSMLNGASAWHEAGRYDQAAALTREVLALARAHRHHLYEGHASWLLRSIAYRAGQAGAPDLELVDASAHLEVRYLEALVCLNEAAVAWRGAALHLAGDLAERARRLFEVAQMRGGRVLSRALALACRSGLLPPDAPPGAAAAPVHAAAGMSDGDIAALAQEMRDEPLDDVDWQVLGMLSRLPGGEAWRDDARRLAGEVPRPALRRELLAPRELLDRW